MTEAVEIIDSKIKELDEKIDGESLKLGKTKSFKYKSKCWKILLAVSVAAVLASTYVLIFIQDLREFIIFQSAVMLAYFGITAIPRHMLTNVRKKKEQISDLMDKREGFEWLRTKSSDQRENIMENLRKRGII